MDKQYILLTCKSGSTETSKKAKNYNQAVTEFIKLANSGEYEYVVLQEYGESGLRVLYRHPCCNKNGELRKVTAVLLPGDVVVALEIVDGKIKWIPELSHNVMLETGITEVVDDMVVEYLDGVGEEVK